MTREHISEHDAHELARLTGVPVEDLIGHTRDEISAIVQSRRKPVEPLVPGPWKGSGATWSCGSRLYIHRRVVDDGQQGRSMGWARIPQYVYRWDLSLDGEVVGHYPGLTEAMAAGVTLMVMAQ